MVEPLGWTHTHTHTHTHIHTHTHMTTTQRIEITLEPATNPDTGAAVVAWSVVVDGCHTYGGTCKDNADALNDAAIVVAQHIAAE